MKRNKARTEIDIYYFYPYKKNPDNTIGIPQPYVKKTDVSNHEYALTYSQWLAIIKDYIELLTDYILSGKVFKMPKLLGTLQLKKYKAYRIIDWGETIKNNEKRYFKSDDRIIVKWYRTSTNSSFKFKNHWKIRICQGFGKKLSDKFKSDPYHVYNIIDV